MGERIDVDIDLDIAAGIGSDTDAAAAVDIDLDIAAAAGIDSDTAAADVDTDSRKDSMDSAKNCPAVFDNFDFVAMDLHYQFLMALQFAFPKTPIQHSLLLCRLPMWHVIVHLIPYSVYSKGQDLVHSTVC